MVVACATTAATLTPLMFTPRAVACATVRTPSLLGWVETELHTGPTETCAPLGLGAARALTDDEAEATLLSPLQPTSEEAIAPCGGSEGDAALFGSPPVSSHPTGVKGFFSP